MFVYLRMYLNLDIIQHYSNSHYITNFFEIYDGSMDHKNEICIISFRLCALNRKIDI